MEKGKETSPEMNKEWNDLVTSIAVPPADNELGLGGKITIGVLVVTILVPAVGVITGLGWAAVQWAWGLTS